MGHNEELLKNVREVVERINDLRDLAYAQYLPAVDEVLAGRITDKNQIEHRQQHFYFSTYQDKEKDVLVKKKL